MRFLNSLLLQSKRSNNVTNDVIQLSKDLISIPSIDNSPHQLKAVLNIAKRQLPHFEYIPYQSEHIPGLLYTNRDPSEKKFKVVLNAHFDVVPGKPEQFKPFEKDGKLYGRGAYDMKSAGAAMILAFKAVAHTVSYPLGLQLVADEEVGGKHGTNVQVQNGIRAEFIIAGEGSGLKIVNGAKGRYIIKLLAKGSAAHSAYPWLGESAIWKMHHVLNHIQKKYPIPLEESQNTTINIAKIETHNSAYNQIPSDCSAIMDIRVARHDEPLLLETIKSQLLPGVAMEVLESGPHHYTDPKNAYIQKLAQVMKQTFNKEPIFATAHGASDLNYFSVVGGQGIEFGPIGGAHHGDGEWVDIESVRQYQKILEDFLLSLNQ